MYAEKTVVSIDRSQAELRKIIAKYGGTSFAYAENKHNHMVMFEAYKRRVVFQLPMPNPPSERANKTSLKTYEQLCRTKWRGLVLAVKAKLECVQSGITSFDQEFLAHIVLPNGRSVGDELLPQVQSAYETGKMPPLMLGMGVD